MITDLEVSRIHNHPKYAYQISVCRNNGDGLNLLKEVKLNYNSNDLG